MEPISRLFTESSITRDGKRWDLRVVNLGSFRLPTGTLAAGDGFFPEPHRSGEQLPTEAGTLELAVGTENDGTQHVLAARVRYADSAIDDWYPLHFRGAKAIDAESGILFGESDVLPLRGVPRESLESAAEESRQPNCAWAAADINGASYVIVDAGMGAGPHCFYRGINADGETVALLLDFTGVLLEGYE